MKVGDEVTAKVVDFNLEDKKVSISIKALTEPEEDKKEEKEDDSEVASVDIEAVIASESEEA